VSAVIRFVSPRTGATLGDIGRAAYSHNRRSTGAGGVSSPGLSSASSAGGWAAQGRHPGWVAALLRVPLVGKIAGANAIIVITALLVSWTGGMGSLQDGRSDLLLAATLAVSLVVNVLLVLIALRPLNALEGTASRVNEGDFEARVPDLSIADSDMRRIGSMVNTLLDGLTSDRKRMRVLAKQVIQAGDRERAHIARELHDSTAQTLAALMLELSVLAGENADPRLTERLERVRKIVADVLDEVKLLAHTVHPRVLDDLGLSAALRLLGRETELRSNLQVSVEGEVANDALSATTASALYRVAQEAVGNALRHAGSTSIRMQLEVDDGSVLLSVVDDGQGFDVADAEQRRPGMGLFTMRERAELVGGSLRIESEKGHGTRIVATVPAAAESPAVTLSARGVF